MLAVAGGKGGCGKTTTTVGLALAADRAGWACLAVDADRDVPDLHRVAGVERTTVEGSIAQEPAEGPRSARDRSGESPAGSADGRSVPRTEPTGARSITDPEPTGARPIPGTEQAAVLPAPRPAADVDPVADASTFARHRRRRELVLLDCPAGGGPDAAAPMRAADRTVVVATPDRASLRDAAKTAAMSRAIGTPVAGAVLTRTESVPDGVGSLLDAPVLTAVPAVDAPLRSPRTESAYSTVLSRLRTER